MWTVVAVNYALWLITTLAVGSLWLIVAHLLKARRDHARRLLTLELEADLAVDVNNIAAGVTNMNRLPWRIRIEWFWQKMVRRVEEWRKK